MIIRKRDEIPTKITAVASPPLWCKTSERTAGERHTMTSTTPFDKKRLQALRWASAQLKPHLPGFAERCTALIQRRIEDYAPSVSGNRRRVIRNLINFASHQFCALLEHRPIDPRFRDTTRRLAAQSAHRGEALDPLIAAASHARVLALHQVDHLVDQGEIAAEVRGGLRAAVDSFIEALIDDMRAGHTQGIELLRTHPGDTRRTLASALFNDCWDSRCDELANAIGWIQPDNYFVASVDADEYPHMRLPESGALYLHTGPFVTFTCDADDITPEITLLGISRSAWTIVDDVNLVARASSETRALVRLSEPGSGPLKCRDFTQLIWLANAPTQWEPLLAAMLAPLDAYKGRYRDQLLETLRVRLSTRGSAPEIAAQLGTHPQTVRKRLHVLNEALGDVLDDPEESMMLGLLLNTLRLHRGAAPETQEEPTAAKDRHT